MKYFETSAKEGKNVDIIFTELVNLILDNKSDKDIMEEYAYKATETSISLDSQKSTKKMKKCCEKK